MSVADKVLIRKRALIESVNLIAGLSAYCFFPKKPVLQVENQQGKQTIPVLILLGNCKKTLPKSITQSPDLTKGLYSQMFECLVNQYRRPDDSF